MNAAGEPLFEVLDWYHYHMAQSGWYIDKLSLKPNTLNTYMKGISLVVNIKSAAEKFILTFPQSRRT